MLKGRRKRYRIISRRRFTISITLMLLLIVLSCSTILSVAEENTAMQGDFIEVIIQPGDTVWNLAKRYFPDKDPRKTTYEICKLNEISPADLRPGKTIQIRQPD